MSKNHWVCVVLLMSFAIGAGGCLVGTSSQVKRDGNYVSEETLKTIEPGKTSTAWVIATLGQPTEKTNLEPGHELWKYSYKETQNHSGYVFIVFGGSDQKVVDGRVFVELKDGIVTKTWRG